MEEGWLIRGFRKGDEQAIIKLFNSIFNRNRTLTQWEWEFGNNPKGQKVLVAEDEGRIFGHIASLHRTLMVGDAEHFASLEVDGMTHPEYARRGVFVALGKELLSQLKSEGCAMALGFPNENAVPGHRKMGALHIFTPAILIKPINIENISGKMFESRWFAKMGALMGRLAVGVLAAEEKAAAKGEFVIKEITDIDGRFDNLWEKARGINSLILKRDAAYLNWRYARHPDKLYTILAVEREAKLLAWMVYRDVDMFDMKNGAIVDMLVRPGHEQAAHALILEVVGRMKQGNVDLIACMMPEWSPYYTILRRCGFMKCPKRLNPKQRPLIVYPLSDELDMNIVKNPEKWHITWGDSDVI
jgi:GNAT superfamily N-acetyltransferase